MANDPGDAAFAREVDFRELQRTAIAGILLAALRAALSPAGSVRRAKKAKGSRRKPKGTK